MSERVLPNAAPRKLWVRALLVLLLFVAFYIAAWVLFFTAVLQLIFAAPSGEPNARLQAFGRSVGRYLSQIAIFVSFSGDEPPFPFSDWPAD